MVLKMLFSSFRLKFTYLQRREIQLGIDNGLSKEEIMLYADTIYNYAQMKQIRLCLEHHVDEKTRKVILDPNLDADEMKKIRYRLERGEIVENKKYYLRKWMLISVELCALLMLSYVTFHKKTQPLLKLETDSITLEVGDSFLPSSYVDVFNGEHGELILPTNIHTSTPGRYVAVYKLIVDDTELTRILYINVKNKI